MLLSTHNLTVCLGTLVHIQKEELYLYSKAWDREGEKKKYKVVIQEVIIFAIIQPFQLEFHQM